MSSISIGLGIYWDEIQVKGAHLHESRIRTNQYDGKFKRQGQDQDSSKIAFLSKSINGL